MHRTFFSFVFLVLFLFSASVVAKDKNQTLNFESMFEDINKEPWIHYQILLKNRPANNLSSENALLWYLLRKAQAENLLYFFGDFEQTVNQTLSLITPQTPAGISSLLHAYAGLIAQRNGNYKKAITSFKLAIEIAQAANLNHIYILAKQEMAYTRSLTDSYHASLIEIQEAYSQALAMDDLFLVATINETYGAIYGYMGKYEQSITYYQQALNSYRNLGYRPYEAEAIYGLATTYRYWKKYDMAIDYFKQYINKTSYTPNKEVTFFGNYGLGMTMAERGDCDTALAVIDLALTLNGQADYNAELYKRKASCYIQMNQLSNAKGALFKAKTIFDQISEIKGTSWQLETLKIEAELANALGDNLRAYQLAIDYYQQLNVIQNNNSTERLSNLQASYEVERRDAKILLLQQQSKVQTLKAEQLDQTATFRIYLLILSSALSIVVLVAFLLQKNNAKKIIAISIRDSLSGLFNRRYIFEILHKRVKALSKRNGNLSVILLDIDDFKRINDQYGHSFGDKVIQTISKICQSTLRDEDVIGRIGGEEFLCVLPRIDSENCLRIAQRMSKNIAKRPFTNENGNSFFVTVSIGISVASTENTSADELFLQADKALYNSKHSGKNQINFF